MVTLASVLLVLLAGMLFVPVCVVAIECVMAALYPDAANREQDRPEKKIRTVVVMPAHNEEAVIGRTLSKVLSESSEQDSVVVVADNCTDSTADIASMHGATVLKRDDQEKRGKGYALDFAMQYLKQSPPDVVVIMDADCHPARGTVRSLAQLALRNNRPIQARYEMEEVRLRESAGKIISGFAWLVRGKVRPIGLAAMGMPCQLYGTGMAFPWLMLQDLPLASSNIVEDMKLTADLIYKGSMPMFCNNASVVSSFPSTDDAASAQRKRWEHGHIATIFRHGIPALGRAMKDLDPEKTMLALDICVPPLALLVTLLAAGSIVSISAIPFIEAARYTTMVFLLAWIMLVAGVSMAWSRFARERVALRTLLAVPAYIVSKLPLYLKFLTDRQKRWNRTDRR